MNVGIRTINSLAPQSVFVDVQATSAMHDISHLPPGSIDSLACSPHAGATVYCTEGVQD